MKAKHASEVKKFTDIPNVGKAFEADFIQLGILEPKELIGKNAYQLYDEICRLTSTKQDPCVIDGFLAAIDFMEGGEPKKWWDFTEERKKTLRKSK